MGMNLETAKKNLNSMVVRVGIGYYLQDGMKKYKDFYKQPDRRHYISEDEYAEAVESAEKIAEEQFEGYKVLENAKVEIILRMPKLDEVLSLTREEKTLPKDINFDFSNKEVLSTALEYLSATTNNTETMKKGLDLFMACIIDSTFEPDKDGKKPTVKELMELVRMNQTISQDALQQFLDASMGK